MGIRLVDRGYLPTWDEAMNLLSTEAFLKDTDHAYAYWFHRHPPLYAILISLVYASPHMEWVHRIHLLHLGLGCLTLWALYLLVRQTAGKTCAFFSLVVYALMPGVLFFDLWIKRDMLVHPFGLMSVFLLTRSKPLLASLCFGLALVTKETAAVYILPLAALWIQSPPERPTRTFVLGAAIVLGVCLPWYLFHLDPLIHYFSFATGIQITETEDWSAPWHIYLRQLPVLLSPWGVGLLVLGTFKDLKSQFQGQVKGAWAFWLVVPGLLGLSLLQGKPPWLMIVFLPALAALAGSGLSWLFTQSWKWVGPWPGRIVGCVFLLGLFGHAWGFDYPETLRRLSPEMAWGSTSSVEAATLVNTRVPIGETFTVSPMYYWGIMTIWHAPFF